MLTFLQLQTTYSTVGGITVHVKALIRPPIRQPQSRSCGQCFLDTLKGLISNLVPYVGLGTLSCSERATALFEMEDGELLGLEDDEGQEQPPFPPVPATQPNLQDANPSMEAMCQELDAMRLSVATLVAIATKTSVSAGSMVAPIQPFIGQDASVSAASWLASFKVKAYAKQLPARHWVATALAALEDDPRSYVEQKLARLAGMQLSTRKTRSRGRPPGRTFPPPYWKAPRRPSRRHLPCVAW